MDDLEMTFNFVGAGTLYTTHHHHIRLLKVDKRSHTIQ